MSFYTLYCLKKERNKQINHLLSRRERKKNETEREIRDREREER
jgi:hypothetical protein